ncbi:S1C family serine protease [Mangrovimonas sp. YM274]|uniref:S1C family serine protease n=1 Tax=Mangrovimonas sp. YM274 TaxID=3070660 RepID=UPI0027DBE6CF|nr:serine protease [Mangrovimonas sp. YM274]WMI70258.1 serine protease [Mangrovimonas sp. YM274]
MRKILHILLIFFSITICAQNDFATINVYRTKAFTIGCNDCVKILLNDVYLTPIDNGGHLELKIFNIKPTKLTITDGKTYKEDVSLNLRNGQIYYFKVKARTPRALGFRLEKETKPVTKKLDSDRFIALSDMGILDNDFSRRPDTDWTKSNLKKHWAENGSEDIEGIYEKIGTSLEYELAVLKEQNEYKIIYLSGASGTNWNEGDIKATLIKTAQFGIFKADWFMLNKSYNKDIILSFDKATMSCLSENGRDKDMYLKIYPTYDEASNSLTTEWKSSGTGFFIDKKGYLVTNYHVVNEGNVFEVDLTIKGKTKSYEAEIISTDRQNDLAILKITSSDFEPLDNLNYNFNTNIQDVGSSVFALGYPLTQIMGNEIKFTDGKISSKSGFQGDITTYQISVPIQPGNSGGPLFDEKGNLVGITSSGINKQLADNANYAIKTSYLKLLVDSTDNKIDLPNNSTLESKGLTDQIKTLSEYVVMIKVK